MTRWPRSERDSQNSEARDGSMAPHDRRVSAYTSGSASMITEVGTRLVRRLRAAERGLRATAIAMARVRVQFWRARLRRRRLRRVVFIGVTGSTGKTTTKELIAAVASTRLKGAKSEWSRNTLRWVARTVLAVRRDDQFCVVEMSATRASEGSLAEVLKLVQPHIGVVTTVSVDHRSQFGTLEDVAAEKGKLIEALPPTGTAVLNADDPRVLAMRSRAAGRVITFGLAGEASVRAEDVRSAWPERLTFTVRYGGRALPVWTQLCGTQWVTAALAALAIGVAMDVPLAEAVRAVESVSPFTGRMSPVEHADGVTFIRDDWKASLGTIGPALQFMKDARAERKIVVMGTISDYPGNATRWYARVAGEALAVADHVVFVGPGATRALRAQRSPSDDALHAFGTVKDAADFLKGFWRPGDLVLVKGSGTADHLARIVLARTERVECWAPRCGKRILCDVCPRL
jgi:UDP-N-acetylmuramoyl-tripeptide--D-alanyl-D-alanine ligase